LYEPHGVLMFGRFAEVCWFSRDMKSGIWGV
jgi:hypothetical protein